MGARRQKLKSPMMMVLVFKPPQNSIKGFERAGGMVGSLLVGCHHPYFPHTQLPLISPQDTVGSQRMPWLPRAYNGSFYVKILV